MLESRGLRRRAPWLFDADSGRRQLMQFFAVHDLGAFGLEERPLAIAAAAAVLGYVEETQKQRLPHLRSIALETSDDAIAMNAATRRHLELDSRVDGDVKATLLGVLDTTVSPMGGRLLRRWLHRPLRDRRVVGERHHAVQTLVDHRTDEDLREAFRSLGDMERILSRVALRSARPRDLSTLRDGLSLLPAVRDILAPLDSPRLQALHAELGEHDATAHMLRAAIVAQPPLLARDGGVGEDLFRLFGERQFGRGGDALDEDPLPLYFASNVLGPGVESAKQLGDRLLALAQDTEEDVLGLDHPAAQFGGFVAGEKERPSRLFVELLEHSRLLEEKPRSACKSNTFEVVGVDLPRGGHILRIAGPPGGHHRDLVKGVGPPPALAPADLDVSHGRKAIRPAGRVSAPPIVGRLGGHLHIVRVRFLETSGSDPHEPTLGL